MSQLTRRRGALRRVKRIVVISRVQTSYYTCFTMIPSMHANTYTHTVSTLVCSMRGHLFSFKVSICAERVGILVNGNFVMSSNVGASFIFTTEKKRHGRKKESRRLMMRKIEEERPRKERVMVRLCLTGSY